MQITQWSKNWNIILLWYANIKESSQDEQQNQTTTTTTKNINYIKNFMSVSKKQNLITKSTYRQINLKLNKITYKSMDQSIKRMDQSMKKFGNN